MQLTPIHYLHIFGLILLFIVVLVRTTTLFKGIEDGQPCQKNRRLFVAFQHSALTIIAGSGIYLLYHQNFTVQPWFYAKIMLFAVMLSSLIKAFKKPNPAILLVQRKAGLVIALFCYCAIWGLVLCN